MFEPTTFGRYVLLKRIAIGGMAEIFRAISYGAEGFEKVVAIKRMLPHLSSDHQFVDMFVNEAKLAASLNHANIVQIYDFGCINNLLFLCMEYIHGKDTSEINSTLRAQQVATPVELACHIFVEVLNGLHHAHRQRDRFGKAINLIHRDMSPPNIMVSYDGEVKIADFGIAKATRSKVQTSSGVLKGKYSYMSPEQAMGDPLDRRTDIFSAAICFYEMLTLTEMFTGHSELEVLRKVREADFIKPREIRAEIPKQLEAILLKALRKNRDHRYGSAAEFRDDLEDFLIQSGLRFSTSALSGFMEKIFSQELEEEQQLLAKESETAEALRPEARSIAKLEAAAAGELETMIIDKDEEEWPPGFHDVTIEKQVRETDLEIHDDDPEPTQDVEEPVDLDRKAFGGEDSGEETIRVDLVQAGLGGLLKTVQAGPDEDQTLPYEGLHEQELSETIEEEHPAPSLAAFRSKQKGKKKSQVSARIDRDGFSGEFPPTLEADKYEGGPGKFIEDAGGDELETGKGLRHEPAPAASVDTVRNATPLPNTDSLSTADELVLDPEAAASEPAVDHHLVAYLGQDGMFPDESSPDVALPDQPKGKFPVGLLILVLLGASVIGGLVAFLIIQSDSSSSGEDASAQTASSGQMIPIRPPDAGIPARPPDKGRAETDGGPVAKTTASADGGPADEPGDGGTGDGDGDGLDGTADAGDGTDQDGSRTSPADARTQPKKTRRRRKTKRRRKKRKSRRKRTSRKKRKSSR